MKSLTLGVLAIMALGLGASYASSQSLVELAKQEQARRAALAEKKTTETEAGPKVYTNADLRAAGRLTTRAGDPPPPRPAAAEDEAGAESEPASDEQQWRNRIEGARQALERAETMAAALQNRVDGLWADFTARDDPGQRAVIEADRQAALDELENTTAKIEELTQDIADIEEEARQANVPPGWLR